ncbi:Kinesin-like protein KIN-4A [Holothuria leucospilota]|uniref:Kinesin-like protein KIN-4A n=1 Tax=Holothuria leucospilota TaxID=206669 RepID=A0A9Q0Y9U6_HOLLE|nr:Kinesin-like protein KIN-4A [Holothuria leucospilota]
MVSEEPEVMALLKKGSDGRATGSTGMNETSSRSHAIFTINIEQISRDDRLVNFISIEIEEVELGATFLLYSFLPKICYERQVLYIHIKGSWSRQI